MIDIANIAKNLVLLEDGIWISKDIRSVSYPADASADCYSLEDGSFWFKHRNDCIIAAIKRFPPGGILFDIGGGNGYVSRELNNNGFPTVLIEPSIVGIRNARLRGLCPVICSTLEGGGFHKNSLSSIGMFDVLEHVRDDVSFLLEAKSYLAPGGRIYLTVPAYNILWSSDDTYAEHFRRYTLGTISNTLSSAGFKVEYGSYFFSLLPIPIFMFRSIPSALGMRNNISFAQTKNEHIVSRGALNRLLDIYLKREVAMLKNRHIHFGSSCLLVAKSLD